MPYFEFGRLGAMTETYDDTDKGTGVGVYRIRNAWQLNWGAWGLLVEFGCGKNGHNRPWRLSWGWNDQITFWEPKQRADTLDDGLDGLEGEA